MLFLFAFLLIFLSGYARAINCDAVIFSKIAECVDGLKPGVNNDVLGAFDLAAPGVGGLPSRKACVGAPVTAFLRFTPSAGDPLYESAVLWGNTPTEVPVTYIPCTNTSNPLLNALAAGSDSTAKCAVLSNTYNAPGNYPVAVFSVSQSGVPSQVEGFYTVLDC